MILLVLALIFGIAVMALLIASIIRGRKKGNSKLVNVLNFVIVLIKTIAS